MKSVKHIGFFKFKPECSDADIAEVWQTMANLPRRIPGIRSFTHGVNTSTEGLSNGFTHSFVMLFESPAALENYLPHPVHQEAVRLVLPRLESVIVCDHECDG